MAFSGANHFAIHGSAIHNVAGNYTVNFGEAGTVKLTRCLSTSLIRYLGDPLGKILPLFSVVNCEAKHRKVKSTIRAEASAGEWLLRHEAYTMWKEEKSPSRLLWLRGIREWPSSLFRCLCKFTLCIQPVREKQFSGTYVSLAH